MTIQAVFRTGSAQDPPGQGGAAWLTAAMLASGGSRTLPYKQILDTLFPMGVSIECQVDQEMIAFCAEAHVDHLDPFYTLLRAMMMDPGWRQDDFDRLLDDAVNYLEVELRGQNDEELAKEVLSSARSSRTIPTVAATRAPSPLSARSQLRTCASSTSHSSRRTTSPSAWAAASRPPSTIGSGGTSPSAAQRAKTQIALPAPPIVANAPVLSSRSRRVAWPSPWASRSPFAEGIPTFRRCCWPPRRSASTA